MKLVTVRVQAIIDDEMEVEMPDDADDTDACNAAHEDWSFTEAHSWEANVVKV